MQILRSEFVPFVALLAVVTIAAPALGQTQDHVSCDASSTSVRLSNTENTILNQNSPNPFVHETTISYKLPDKAKKAQMMFYDARGKLIRSVDITSRDGRPDGRGDEDAQCVGLGRVAVFGDDLSDGPYTYALVVDGRTVDSKRMIKSR